MKRCPQCEFIYEDDQSHCDMDGTRLIHDNHKLPKLQALNTTTSVEKSKTRGRLVALVATLVLAGVMALVYYVSMRQPPRTTAVAIPPPAVDTAPPNAAVSPAAASETAMPVQSVGSNSAPAENTNNAA